MFSEPCNVGFSSQQDRFTSLPFAGQACYKQKQEGSRILKNYNKN